MIHSILVPTDLSPGSADLLQTAAELAYRCGAELHLLHVFDLQESPYTHEGEVRTTFQGRVGDAERKLDDQIRRTVAPHIPVTSREVVIRTPYKAILERARDVKADLIVLGPHRQHRVADALLGSTADRVVRTADVPCLIVRGPLSLPLRRIVVPMDLSQPAGEALEVAIAWATALGETGGMELPAVTVDVVHVVPSLYEGREVPFERAVVGPELHRGIEAARKRAPGGATVEVREEVVWSDRTADAILRFAGEESADLLCLATHGYGAIRRALIGSVASAIARRAPGPVLLVPPRMWAERAEPGEDLIATMG